MDNLTKEQRSRNMSAIKATGSKIEVKICKALWAKGYWYRKNCKDITGKPDIVLPKYKAIIFINGCFWHGHTCKFGALPKTNTRFWHDKIGKNVLRDRKNIRQLKKEGWNVIVIWQCKIRNKKKFDYYMGKIINKLQMIK